MKGRLIFLKRLIVISFMAYPSILFAQWESDYVPKIVYNEYSHSLIRSLTIQGAQQIMLLEKDEKELSEYFASNTLDLIELVQNKKFLRDDTLRSYLHQIIKNITETSDINTPRKVLVLKSTKANAYSLGDGTLVICNGLLAKLNSEKELAFILAHEMAHWELTHFKKKIIQTIEATEMYSPEKQFKEISKGSYSLESVQNVKKWHYNRRRYSREVELQADSLALILYLNAYENSENGILALQNLDSGLIRSPYLGPKIFEDLNFNEAPFNKEWAIVSQKGHVDISNYSAFHPDSSMTHPVLEERIQLLKEYIGHASASTNAEKDTAYLKIKTDADFENIGSAVDNGNLDEALYLALRLKKRFPQNSYLVESIGNILLNIYDRKKDDIGIEYEADTTGYNKEQLYVYNFVHNVRRSDLAELAFYFMNKKENFNRQREAHYKILYDLCELTNRRKMMTLVKEGYSKAFEEGKLLKDMN